MYIAFPIDEKVKARLEAVCKSFNVSLEEWFESALKASEFDVLTNLLNSPKDQISWMWDEKICRFVRRSDVD
ncbi:hypothetical protein REC12_02795 [Desulfosporosinus sp. PR]|uniref:hypothetical protein n=1 Tax=Candidatus Desulfosporosinus nitrosoreducens TaxID=3401928 RepID=UPI0027EB94DA|nr:hypothetical protein [Desulfosporosinus sp. PR]MDQ7092513.1 hypothetical protein [Desulfosporosinus sp. PR]